MKESSENIPSRINLKHVMLFTIDIHKEFGFDDDFDPEDVNECFHFLIEKGEFECHKLKSHLRKNNIKNITYDYLSNYLNETYSVTSEKDDEFVDFSLGKLHISNNEEVKVFLNNIDRIGVYILSENDNIYNGDVFYIGFSTNLKSRILSSITERKLFNNYDHLYISVIDSFNTIDSFLLESYLINKFSPTKNKGGKYNQKSELITSVENFEISQLKCYFKNE